MSIADYNQRAEDHQSLLILVKPSFQRKPLGQSKSNGSSKSFSRVIERITSVTNIPPPHPDKHVWLRYRRVVHIENSDWGDFQAHRKILGLIFLGRATSEIELASIYSQYETLKDKYSSSLYDSRCFVFGMHGEDAEKSSYGIPTGVFFFENAEECEQLEDRVKDFGSSLFWVLESKRLERLKDRSDKLPLLMVPFEKKDMVGIDTESRNFRRKVQGRMKKHLADLTLMAGMTQEALLHYQTALEMLRGANDWMWMGACLEGMCAASVIMHFPPKQSKAGLPRNASFNSELLLHGEQERKPIARVGSTLNVPLEGSINGTRENCLSLDEINEKYKEAIMHYSRYTNAAIIVLEASIKATQVLIQQKKKMEAADFLQNIVYINLNVTFQEKVQRYVALSRLYDMIGFHRKAAFFKRVAAMQCGSKDNWDECHDYLLETMDGYKLRLDPWELRKDSKPGWPALQIRLLTELVYTTGEKLGDYKLAMRYLSFLLHGFHDKLDKEELKKSVTDLERYSSKAKGSPQPLYIDSGLILPPVPFMIFPTVKSFRLLPLSSQLTPHVVRRKNALLSPDVSSSPFIYSPIQAKEDPFKKRSMAAFKWVAGDVCEVSMEVYNPLPFELRVGNLGFLTEGPTFDSIPATVTLPGNSGPHTVSILGTPKTQGTLKVIGYTTEVWGVESHCRLSSLPDVNAPHFLVVVVPPLPLLKVTTSLPKATQFLSLDQKEGSVSCSAYISLMAGESMECEVKLTNSGKIPVSDIDIFLEDDENVQEVFSWSEENIKTQLPLEPGHHITFTLYIKAMGNFIATKSSSSSPSTPVNFPTTPTPRKMLDLKQHGKVRRLPSTAFLETSYNPSFPQSFDPTKLLKVIESNLKFRYSGSDEGSESYSRVTTLLLRAEIQPSVAFSHWTTIPASDPKQFHLLLDVLNATSHEVNVQYDDQKSLLLETKACKRLAITLDRFSVDGVDSRKKSEKKLLTSGFYQVVSELYAQQLASLVDIRWQCHATEKEGFASTADIPITETMLDNIDFCPIEWHVTIDGQPYYPQDTYSSAVGEAITMKVSVEPTIDVGGDQVQFEVCPFQDDCNGTVTPDVSETILCAGCFQSRFYRLAEEPEHICTLTYLFPGHYKVSLTCLQRSAEDDRGGKLWRFRPPIDIIVMDTGAP